jgi:hypothetical protein
MNGAAKGERMRIPKTTPVRVDIDIDDLPLATLERLDKIAAMTKLAREEVFAVAVAMGIVAEGLDGADKS